MDLKQTIQNDVKSALKAGEKLRLGTLRMLMAAIKQREVDERISLDDSAILGVVEKLVKQRLEAATQFRAGNRPELEEKELAEADILRSYLPEPLDASELDALIDEVIAETGASSMKDMGRVMAGVKERAAGRADMSQVSGQVKSRLGS